jgi:hypothetical protein
MLKKITLAATVIFGLSLTSCGSEGSETELEGQRYNCDEIGEACIGGKSGNPGTIQPCQVLEGCCCQTMAGKEEPIRTQTAAEEKKTDNNQ